MDTGEALRFYRRLAEKTQTDVAVALGRSQGYVSLIERGLIEPTDVEKEKIEELLGVGVFLSLTSPKKRKSRAAPAR